MERNNPLRIVIQINRDAVDLVTNETIDFEFIKPFIDQDNIGFILSRGDLSWKNLKFLRGLCSDMDIMSSPSFSEEMLNKINKKITKLVLTNIAHRKIRSLRTLLGKLNVKHDFSDLLEKIDSENHSFKYIGFTDYEYYKHDGRYYNNKKILKSLIERIPAHEPPREYKTRKMRDISIEHIYKWCVDYDTSKLAKLKITSEKWNYGKGYASLYDDIYPIDIGMDEESAYKPYKSLKWEIKELVKICFRFNIPQEILHQIAEFVLSN